MFLKMQGKLVLTIDYPFACSEKEPCFNKKTRKKINIAYRKSRKMGIFRTAPFET